jgi:hypothetical protein
VITKTFTTAAGAVTDVFRVLRKCDVVFDFWGTWNSATVTLTRTALISDAGASAGTYHTFKVATDPTLPLTGAAFTVSADLATVLTLLPGSYGLTIAGTPTSVNVDIDGNHCKNGVNG